jgi:50S ribosomal protein L16 3-hydroxylase
MIHFPVLGDISADQFLAEYWQKKPLLIRNALENFTPPINANELAGLSLENEIESRLVVGEDWKIEHGPFDETRFQQLGNADWTLLVQGVNLWIPQVADLLDHFAFLPSWRIDDIMVSYATDGGSVGPHFDNYDVFLIQGSGSRRWLVGDICNTQSPLIAHEDLRILADFQAQYDWVLNTGDMLYLPPNFSHHGIAMGECTTFSVGFRAPSAAEILDDLTTELISQDKLSHYLKDPTLEPDMADKPIPRAYIEQIRKVITDSLMDDETLMHWFAEYMTRPKYPHLTEITGERRSARIVNPTKKEIIEYKNGYPD